MWMGSTYLPRFHTHSHVWLSEASWCTRNGTVKPTHTLSAHSSFCQHWIATTHNLIDKRPQTKDSTCLTRPGP